jgi:glycosyltransferase involved in cell wall biosynthesis
VRIFVELELALIRAGAGEFRFLIVGDGSERLYLDAHLARARLPGVLRGASLADAYASMDALVFPSETDTFGNVVLEAMASGVVPVVSDAGGPKYLVDHGKTGYIARDVHQYVRAIVDLQSHPMKRLLMAESARAAAQAYSWDAVFDRVHRQYRSVLRRWNGQRIREYPLRRLGLACPD